MRIDVCAGNSVATLINAVNGSSRAELLKNLNSLKSGLAPFYPAPAESKGFSLPAKVAIFGALSWILYRADQQARAHEWIVDLSLNVLQAAWVISFLSFLPFRSIFVALRSAAPHTAAPISTLRTTAALKP